MINMENKLLAEISKMEKVHAKACEIFQHEGLSRDIRLEFKGKNWQYDDMLKSLDTMKQMTDSEETKKNLVDQQLTVVRTRIEFELDIMKRAIAEIGAMA